MKRRRIIAATAFGAAAALLVSACSGSGSSSGSSSTTTGAVAFNAGISGVVNPSTHKGGTLIFDNSGTPDSFDPGNTYYAWVLRAGPQGRRGLADGVSEGAAVPAVQPHQRLRAAVLRHVQLRGAGRQFVTVPAAEGGKTSPAAEGGKTSPAAEGGKTSKAHA